MQFRSGEEVEVRDDGSGDEVVVRVDGAVEVSGLMENVWRRLE